jgi:hypothetical protein
MTVNLNGSEEKIIAERKFPEGLFTSGLAWSSQGNTIICGEYRDSINACTLVEIQIEDSKERIIHSQEWRYIEDIECLGDARNIIINANRQSNDNQIWGMSIKKSGSLQH